MNKYKMNTISAWGLIIGTLIFAGLIGGIVIYVFWGPQ
jgi:hypothetical protein